jgi:integrase
VSGVRKIAVHAGATTPDELTAAAIAAWTHDYELTHANNSVRGHVTSARMFLRWCAEEGHIDRYRDAPVQRILRSYPPIYGKRQSVRPANRLDATGYAALIAACQDGTETGMRDELVVRLGVSGGMRAKELRSLTVASTATLPELHWTGKANKPRSAKAGPELVALVHRYLAAYDDALGCFPSPDAPLICRGHASSPGRVSFGHRCKENTTMRNYVRRRAAIAGLGWMTPHDLKRTAARMMHEARTAEGGHLFDLLDIADVLDHDNPKITKDCYIGPLGNENKDRAAALFG